MQLDEIKGDLKMLHVIFIVLVYCASTFLAYRIGGFSGHKWVLGFVIGATIIFVLNLPKFIPPIVNHGFYQLMLGNNLDAMLIGIAGIISVIPCLPKLSGGRTKLLIVMFLLVSLLRSSVLPAACFYFNKNELNNLSGRVDSNGVVIQTTGYTCGPAATATILKALGIRDTESGIALATGCNSYSGTRSLDLVNYINRQYGNKLNAEYRYVDNVDYLRELNALYIVEVKASTFTDHFIAIMDINGNSITVGDPSMGRFETTTEAFSKEWRNKVIVISRK